MSLFTLVYVSVATKEMSDDDLMSLLEQSKTFNKANGLKGLLLYKARFFIQVLEGEENIIDDLFERIKLDTRHFNVLRILKKPIIKRSFEQWAMGFKSANLDKLKQMPSFSDYMLFKPSDTLDEYATIFESEIKSLLYPFASHH
jgi:hypothetical protein